jgi:hypothetical protein
MWRWPSNFTPTSTSWLNLVERWFAELTNRKLGCSTHRSVAELKADLTAWIDVWERAPAAVCVDQDRRRDPRHPRQ